MSNYDNNTTRRFPAAFGGQRRGGGGYNNRGGAGRGKYQEVRYPAPEKKEAPKTVDLTSEMNFPSLGGGSGWGSASGGAGAAKPAGKSFATMASDWKETEEAEAARIAYEREREEEENRRNRRMLTGIFTKSRLHTETRDIDEYYQDEYDEEYIPHPPPGYPEDEGWSMVDNAKKRAAYADRGSRWEEGEEDDEY